MTRGFKQILLLLLFLLLGICSKAKIYYSRADGNWANSATWSTLDHTSSINLGTFPSNNDTVYIGHGCRVYINVTVTTNIVFVGDGIWGGYLEYLSSGTYNLTISNRMTVNSDGTFYYNSSSGFGRTHQFILQGDFVNNGTVDFDFDANDVVLLNISGSVNTTISGSGSFDLKSVMMNKSSVNYYVEVTAVNCDPAIETFSAFAGKWIHNNSSVFDINPSSNFQINSGVVMECDAGGMKFASSSTTLILQGTLIVDGGTVSIGSITGTVGIRTDQSGSTIASLIISSGTLTVYGGISFKTGSGNTPFKFVMDGGIVNLHTGTVGMNAELLKVNDVVGSEFNMTAGTIIMQKPNLSSGTSIDFDVCGTNGSVNVTGGELQFGNSSTASGLNFNFKPYQNIILPGMVVAGPNASGTTVCPAKASNDADTMRMLYLRIEAGSSFNHRSFSGSVGDNKALVLTSSRSGTAFYNAGSYIPQTGRTVFAGTSDQLIDGTSAQTFYGLEVRNSSTVTLNVGVTLTNTLVLTNGLLVSTTSKYPTLGAGATTTVGSSSSYVSGPMMYQMASTGPATLNFPIGAGGKWRPNVLSVTHSSSATASYYVRLVNSPASALFYTLPATLSRVSGVRYYQFVRTGASNFTSATMQIYYGSDDGVTDASTLRVAQASGPNWLNQGGTGTANGTGAITSASFNAFTTIYALGNSTGGSIPLPVSLVSFTAFKKDRSVQLKWTIASELNNERFEVLRSKDGVFFDVIGHTAGAGTTSQTNEYLFTDEHPMSGYNFYRLRQIDFDGTFTEFMTRTVNFLDDQVNVYPSVSDGKNVFVKLPEHFENSSIVLYSLEGKVVMDEKVQPGQAVFRLPEMSKGNYRAYIRIDGNELIRPIMVVN